MVGSIKQIEQTIAALDQATAAIAEEFYSAYSNYLTVLGQAVRQQLILASYHVCTQGYPEQFLRLSYSQRQQLQQTLKTLAQQVQEELLAQLHVPVVPEDLDDDYLPVEFSEPSTEANFTAGLTQANSAQALTPTHLAEWREDLEQAIVDEMRTASHAANRLLQQASLLPKKLPESILEAATKAEAPEIAGSHPNLLNAIVEAVSENAENSEDAREHSVMHIIAIHLRLVEIEFADTTTASARSKIRNLSAQLKTLGREYQKKHRERAIAEAQAAWRSSWSEN